MTKPQAELHYFERRAEQELRRAELAAQPEAARAHALLAGYYLDLVHNGGASETALAAPSGMQAGERDPARTEPQRQARPSSYQAAQSQEERDHGRRP